LKNLIEGNLLFDDVEYVIPVSSDFGLLCNIPYSITQFLTKNPRSEFYKIKEVKDVH